MCYFTYRGRNWYRRNDRIISDRFAEKYLDGEKNFLKRIEKWVKKESYSKLKGLGIQINFQNIKLEEIKENNHFIKQKDYMCSIYSYEKSMAFQELKLWGKGTDVLPQMKKIWFLNNN